MYLLLGKDMGRFRNLILCVSLSMAFIADGNPPAFFSLESSVTVM